MDLGDYGLTRMALEANHDEYVEGLAEAGLVHQDQCSSELCLPSSSLRKHSGLVRSSPGVDVFGVKPNSCGPYAARLIYCFLWSVHD